MPKIMISAEHAAKLLPHTFFKILGWIGADVDRIKVLAAFGSAHEVEVSPDAACFDHQLAVKLGGTRTYIDTNQKALHKLVPHAVTA